MEQINDNELQALIQRVVRQQLDAFQRQQNQEQGPTNKPAPRMPKRPHPKRKKEKTPPPPAKPTNKAVQYLAYVLNQGVIHPDVPTTVILTPNGNNDSAQITYNPYNGSFFVSYKGRVKQYYLVTKYNNDIQALANDLYAAMSRENSRTQSPINVHKKNLNNPPFSINKMVGK